MMYFKIKYFFFHENVYIREQTSLEEGEIPWLQYNEVNESSSDEGNEPANEFAQPEAFMLDGNNNLEDDSSVRRLRNRVTLISWEAEHPEQQIGQAFYMQRNIPSAYYIRVTK